MINHSNCDHPSTSGARAKCRRAQSDGSTPQRKKMNSAPREKVEKDDSADNYGQTPSRRDLECDNCGVERIAYKGTDPLTGIVKYVGEKCYYIVKRAADITPLD